MLRILVWSLSAASLLAADLCPGEVIAASSDWLWSRTVTPSPSCTDPPLQNPLQMCSGDSTSIVIQGNGQPQCLASRMDKCKFNMHNISQIDFSVTMKNCGGTWAAPLWMTPDYWAGLGLSGEIDMLELCPDTAVYTNFGGAAFGNLQKRWTFADPNDFSAHVTFKKAPMNGGAVGVRVQVCKDEDMLHGECPMNDVAYIENIYATNACNDGHDCTFTFVSDIFNGNSGNSGYAYCANGHTHASSGCRFSVRNISVKASPGTFVGDCAALVNSSTPIPSSASCSAHPACVHLAGNCCPTSAGVILDCCNEDHSLNFVV